MDTDSEVDSNMSSNGAAHQHPVVDESSEEEWTYTSARMDVQQQHKNKNNAKMRLDFDAATETIDNAKLDNCTDSDALNGNVVDEGVQTGGIIEEKKKQSRENNNSDDECANDKDSIQKLIREVSCSFFKIIANELLYYFKISSLSTLSSIMLLFARQ